ncbi:hypothetical protein, partial [Prevotella sp.]|uniref:hypothetical protein n=1 Tax=Prevotella sp. TaxID=59823 RepID=UPI00307840B0
AAIILDFYSRSKGKEIKNMDKAASRIRLRLYRHSLHKPHKSGLFPKHYKRNCAHHKSGKTKCARFEKRNVQKSGKTKRSKKIAHTTL